MDQTLPEKLRPAIVAVQFPNGDTEGTGFFVTSDGYILTCYHVISKIADTSKPRTGQVFDVKTQSGDQLKAEFIGNISKTEDYLDFAFLKTKPSDDKGTIKFPCLRLGGEARTKDTWYTFGQEMPDRYDGVPNYGEIIGVMHRTEDKSCQDINLNAVNPITGGISGSPVFNECTGSVVGLIKEVRGERQAFAVSIQTIFKAWPALEELNRKSELLINVGVVFHRKGPDQHIRVQGARPKDNGIFFDREFKDRVESIKELFSILSDDADKKTLVCIYGRNGMGKTSLFGKVLWDIERDITPYPELPVKVDGIVYLTKGEGINFEKLFENCSRVLGSGNLQDQLDTVWRANSPIEKKNTTLLDALNQGKYIILVDGLEELLDDEGNFREEHGDIRLFFEKALEKMNSSCILVSSTKPLMVRDSSLRRRTHQTELQDGLPLNDAIVHLRGLDPLLKEASEDQLKKIAGVTHCIPRALEQIAGILSLPKNRNLTLDDIANRIYDFPEVVKELGEETYNGLDARGRQIVEALAIFDRPVLENAILFMLETPQENEEISNTLTRLAETHVIIWDTKETKGRRLNTFCLHQVDQSYIYSRINEKGSPNKKGMHRRAADYYRTQQLPEDQWHGREDIEPQILEFDHHLKAGDYDGAAQLMDTIDYSWKNHHKYLAHMMAWGYGLDAIRRREKLLDKLSPVIEVYNLTSLGWVCRRMGRTKEAEIHFQKAVDLAKKTGDPGASFYSMSEFGYFLTDNANRHDLAEYYQNEALKFARDPYSQAHALLGLAFADFQRQNNSSSLKNARNALDLFRQISSPLSWYRQIDCWVRLGMIHRKEGNYEAAIQTAKEGLNLADNHDLWDWKGELSSGLGFHYRALGQYTDAEKWHNNALNLFIHQCGMKREEAVQYSYLANLFTDTGHFTEAQKNFEAAEQIADSFKLRRELSWIVANKGILFCRMGDYKTACFLQQSGLRIVLENNHLDSQVVRLTDLAGTLFAMGESDKATESLLRALQCGVQDLEKNADEKRIKLPGSFPEAFLQAPFFEDKLPHEMQSPGDHQRRGALLTRIFLQTDHLDSALQIIEVSRKSKIGNPHLQYLAALHGLVLLRMHRFELAESIFQDAKQGAEVVLGWTENFFEAQYTLGLVYAAFALIHTGQKREENLRQALDAYQKAVRLCGATGVINDAISLFKELSKIDEQGILFPILTTVFEKSN